MEYKDFENAFARLETIVEDLEKGDLALEEALKLFEEGVKISQFCNAKLDEARPFLSQVGHRPAARQVS